MAKEVGSGFLIFLRYRFCCYGIYWEVGQFLFFYRVQGRKFFRDGLGGAGYENFWTIQIASVADRAETCQTLYKTMPL